MGTFRKNNDCPASIDVLAFQVGTTSAKEDLEIRRHLAACEFCVAEIDFYSHYPPTEEIVELTQIPRPMFELATALLTKKTER